MVWKIEDSTFVEADIIAIFTHLLESYRNTGHAQSEAFVMAEQRIKRIRESRFRIAKAPHIGTRRFIADIECRNVTLDRAIYWFTLNEPAETVQIEGIFFSGQDHLGRMLSRLTAEDGGAT